MLPAYLEHTIHWIVQLGIQKRLLHFSATLYLIALCRERFKWMALRIIWITRRVIGQRTNLIAKMAI